MALETYQCAGVSGAGGSRSPAARSRNGFSLTAAGDAGRGEVEAYIAAVFAANYGARIHSFLPLLLSQRKRDSISSALGLRRADRGTLFLEQYLDRPVEEVLTEATRHSVARADIVEIGNLVSTCHGSTLMLFLMLAELFAAAGMTWAIFTATPEVHSLLQKLALDQVVLCRADGERLGAELADWGSYYDTHPSVTAVNVSEGRQTLLKKPLTRRLILACTEQAQALAPVLRATDGVESCN